MSKQFSEKIDYYSVLGVEANASKVEIAKAYNDLKDMSTEEYENLKEQYQDLKDKTTQEAVDLYQQMAEINKDLSKLEAAYDVLTTDREKYDKARLKYLEKENKKASKKHFNEEVDYYAFLNVSEDATEEEIKVARNNKIRAILMDDNLSDEEKNEMMSKTENAYTVLTKYRSKYDKKRKKVVAVEDGEKEAKNGKKVLATVAVGALAAAVIFGSGYFVGNLDDDKDKDTDNDKNIESEADVTTETIYDEDTNTVTLPSTSTEAINDNTTEATTEEITTEEVVYENVKFCGDATDDTVVTERVEQILTYFEKAGIINMETSQPYTVDEIKDILLYMNGAYIATDEAEVYTMTNRQLNFICGPLSSMHALDIVSYMSGGEVTQEMLQQDISSAPMIDWTDALLMGDSECYPYLKWFSDKYTTMMTTTDREVFVATYDEIGQSLADLCYGNGFVVDGQTFTINDFAGISDVNDGNVLQFLVYLYQIGRVEGVTEEFVVNNRQAGQSIVYLDDILEQFNPVCDEQYLGALEIDENGNYVTKPGDSFGTRVQVNTINAGLTNYYQGNLNYYEDNYKYTLN